MTVYKGNTLFTVSLTCSAIRKFVVVSCRYWLFGGSVFDFFHAEVAYQFRQLTNESIKRIYRNIREKIFEKTGEKSINGQMTNEVSTLVRAKQSGKKSSIVTVHHFKYKYLCLHNLHVVIKDAKCLFEVHQFTLEFT